MSGIDAGAVVVGIDGSESALNAVRWAAVEARSLACPLHIVHATVWPLVRYPVPPAVPAHYRTVMVEQAQGWLKQAGEVAAETAPGVEIQQKLMTGDAGPALVLQCSDAREVVVGSRGLGGFTGMIVGSTAMILTHHAQCPVVVVRETGDPAGPVVVGVDGSPASENAVEYAFEAAARANVPLVAVHTWSDVGVGELWGAPRALLDWDEVKAEEQRLLSEQLAGWQEKHPEVTVITVVAQDHPAHRLNEQARGARLLVVGSRGRGGFTGMLLGSTSRTLVQHAPCPLAVVRS
jgi:nucleotide-binding universal stress UspA family protein